MFVVVGGEMVVVDSSVFRSMGFWKSFGLGGRRGLR